MEHVTELIKDNVGVNQQSERTGCTALHKAVEYGHVQLIETLCEAGANADLSNKWGSTPLHFAIKFFTPQAEEICFLLLKSHASVNREDRDGHTALQLAHDFQRSLEFQEDVNLNVEAILEQQKMIRFLRKVIIMLEEAKSKEDAWVPQPKTLKKVRRWPQDKRLAIEP
mmetsp:Transcript_33507/g.78525  ORF Transcript_33507/g.78525 Transcript_33507/m.78525 type:complete len:169 (-) Transcript_33507:34-540(-)